MHTIYYRQYKINNVLQYARMFRYGTRAYCSLYSALYTPT